MTTIDPANPAAATATAAATRVGPPKLEEYPVAEGVKLTETPADFDYKKHRRIFEKHWATKADLMDHQAYILEQKAKDLRKGAHDERTRGPELKAKKKFLAMQAQLAKLAEELAAQGINVDDIE